MSDRWLAGRRAVLGAGAGAAGAALLGGCRRGGETAVGELRLAVASDLAAVMPALTAAFAAEGGERCQVTPGSTGLLSRQITEGAPFDALLAAHVRYVDGLIRTGHAVASSRVVYARGRLALWSRDRQDLTLGALGSLPRVAIANPEHAPYGQAARQALERSSVWGAVQGRLVVAENIQQAWQLVVRGEVEAGLVAWSLAKGQPGYGGPIDAGLHDPIEQGAAAVARSPRAARAEAFCRWLGGPRAGGVLVEAGFERP